MSGDRKQKKSARPTEPYSDKPNRLTVRLERQPGSPPLTEPLFKVLVQEAVLTVLGEGAPSYEVASFDPTTGKGALIAYGISDVQLIWAALSIFGVSGNRKVAFHLNQLTEVATAEY